MSTQPRVIPVIDLMRGQVVRGVAGRREEYRPIQSVLAADASPAAVGKALVDFGFRQAYVADLDAIAGAEPAWDVYTALTRLGLGLWVDAGVGDRERADRLARFTVAGAGLDCVIVGLESIAGIASLGEVTECVGLKRVVFSLDLNAGRPITSSPDWLGQNADQVAASVLELGLRRMIVLDLARVGVDAGVGTEDLCRRLARRDPALELIAGGGVRGREDLLRLGAAGCRAALVASALHDGRLRREDIFDPV